MNEDERKRKEEGRRVGREGVEGRRKEGRKRDPGERKGEKTESRENEGTGCRRGQKGEMRGVGMSMRGWRTRERESRV